MANPPYSQPRSATRQNHSVHTTSSVVWNSIRLLTVFRSATAGSMGTLAAR